MAFEGLSEKLQAVFQKLTGRGKLNETQIKEAMREIRVALLEADVNFIVARDFIKRVTQRATGSEILESLTPGQQVVKIVNEEMTQLMGAEHNKLTYASQSPTIYMLCGLQGVGKTTMAAKLALYLRKQSRKPMLAACDIYRPAAVQQLRVVGERAGAPVFYREDADPVDIAREAVNEARRIGCDVLLLDTAGRLHIDDALMDELQRMKAAVKPQEILLVVDAMIGQDSVNVAETFHNTLGIDGVILTKLDSDSRGGAALSVKAVTGKPIKFAGVGEKLEDLEPFHPERMASRILGMGDVLSLIEKAQSAFDEKKAAQLEQKLRTQQFTLEDFLEQFSQIRQMGSLQDILGMLPGMGGKNIQDIQVDEKQMGRMEAIIRSMTPGERNNPEIIHASRKRRIAAGSGVTVQDVNQLLKQFNQTRVMMKQFSGMGKAGRRGFKFPFS